VQTSPDGSRSISGYAIRFNEPSSDLGGFTEIVAPGAVTESLKNNPDVICLRDHDQSLLMGRTKSKTLTLTEDANGLRFNCKLPATTQAADLAESIDRGDLDGVSFGFATAEDKWTSDGAGNVIRTLLKVDLFEISPCSFPAYPSTSVSVRSCPASLRGLIRSNSEDDEDDEDDCSCTCAACEDGNCEDCTDTDCEDPNCDHNERSARHKMHMRLALALRK
jgi:uncharacterized protein